MRDYLSEAPNRVRRKDRAVEDDCWIREKLRSAPYGVLATSHEGQPFVNANMFAFAEDEHVIYMHTARSGRTKANVGVDERVAFTVFEMGRLLPAPRAFNMSVEYEGVVIFGSARVLESDEDKARALQMLVDKYFGHLRPGVDYVLPTAEELSVTSVYRIAIDSWSGKRKAVDRDYVGAFLWSGRSTEEQRQHG